MQYTIQAVWSSALAETNTDDLGPLMTGDATGDTGLNTGGTPFNVCQPSAVCRAWIKY